jgi:hypothetical protein
MEIRRDVSLGTGLITAICVVLAFGIIGLFSRMTPAVEAILKNNVGSQAAAFDILEVVSHRSAGAPLDAARLREAIARARANLTVEGESEAVAALEEALGAAAAGDAEAVRRLVEAARRLWDLNMTAMREADAGAVRLGAAGAWTAVFGGILVIVVALASWARLKQRVVEPLEDIARVLHGVRGQHPNLRCLRSGGAADIDQVRGHLNDLLDDMKRLQTGRVETGKAAIRASLVTTLEHLPHPAAIIHHDGRIVAGNAPGLAFFGTRAGGEARRYFAGEALHGHADRAFDVGHESGRAHIAVHPVEAHDASLCLVESVASPATDDGTPVAPDDAAAAEGRAEGARSDA